MDLKDYVEAPPEAGHKTQAAIAEALGVTPGAVSHWVNGHRPIPPAQAIPLELATAGKVSRYETRPDIYPREVA